MGKKRAKTKLSPEQQAVSIGLDYFRNLQARIGYGTPSLPESTEYEMVRLSNNYWLMLTLYRNHWIARRVVDLPAQDMTRSWAKLTCQIPPDDIQEFDRTVMRTFTPNRIRQALKWSRLYGGAGCLIAIKGHEKKLAEPLDLDDVLPGSYMGLIPFDRWVGIQPNNGVSNDLENPREWGIPESYTVTDQDSAKTFEVHGSRILRFLGPEVPKPELEAQLYWGISVLEVIWEELRKRDNASWAILNLLFRAQIIAQRNPELAQLLSGLGMSQTALKNYTMRMQAQNELMSNQSMMVLGKEGEMFSVQYAFSGIGDVYAQFQMDVAGAAEIPVTRLFGKTIGGLGQSNDADERYYEERIAQEQDGNLRPQLDKLYPVIAMSVLGEVPDDLDFTFPSIRVLSEEEKAEMTEKASTPIIAAYNAGLISQQAALKELRQLSDTTNVFSNITDEDIDKADDEPQMPGELDMEETAASKPNPGRQEKKLAGGAET